MSWKFVRDLWFHEVLQTTIVRQITLSNIYIYSHPETDCFVLSELFSVARHGGRSEPGSKPVQLYVRQ